MKNNIKYTVIIMTQGPRCKLMKCIIESIFKKKYTVLFFDIF